MTFLRPAIRLLLLCSLVVSCSQADEERNAYGEALGTTYSISYYSEDEIPLEKALDSIFERVNQSMSTYRESSDISRINRGDSLVEVDTLFQNVFKLSKEVWRQSNGYFDPTVGDLVNQYGFGPENGPKEIDSVTIDSLMQFVGFEKLELNDNLLIKDTPNIYLDFNAIAKGYAIDLVGYYLDSKNVDNYLIELGGELLAKGMNVQKGAYWTVGIDDPMQEVGQRELTATIELRNRAMATSGNYRKHRTDPETGAHYVHTINPLTGFAQKSDLLSVTVLAENCALADAYATAFMAMGFDLSKMVLSQENNLDAFLIYSTLGGEMKEYATPGFDELMKDL
ncbi:FAD:protein FMN transferase [Salinimicrobium tongyeongense]|uniref:FAD:protein FMN transferase n=1 Tax=Salinimicrobium tongyeongense TaxID=2809707 RepID=A0ABY6NST6_9FLAO|nr:FAD:protein FMN transferase [Salinimicrobium tongyeongense]UZH55898.1 FAD:protein FMN transferase [Salinimicrobium tongyeongense]